MDELLAATFRRTDGRAEPIEAVELIRPAQRFTGLKQGLTLVRERLFGVRMPFETIDAELPEPAKLNELRERATRRMEAAKARGGFVVLFTGATGFVGMECVERFARDPDIARVICLVRPQEIRERGTGKVTHVIQVPERGEHLLEALDVAPQNRKKFVFIEGDVEKPMLGIGDRVEELAQTVTHVIHCAASVDFDEPYDKSKRANVDATQNSIDVSLAFNKSADSPFVAHMSIETAFIHGRTLGDPAEEAVLRFPRGGYSNYYELTKAMGSVLVRNANRVHGLPVMQILPAIVVGRAACGSNHGDRKVLNGPFNILAALASQATEATHWLGRAAARNLVVFPGIKGATLNVVSVDRVADAMASALSKPEAIGNRIHIGSREPIELTRLAAILREELVPGFRMMSPLVHALIFMPLFSFLIRFAQGRLKRILPSIIHNSTIFRTYTDGLQPRHVTGGDERILKLPPAPDPSGIVRMVCRHNKYVFLGTKTRKLKELEQRAETWRNALAVMSEEAGHRPHSIPCTDFHGSVPQAIDLSSFTLTLKDLPSRESPGASNESQEQSA